MFESKIKKYATSLLLYVSVTNCAYNVIKTGLESSLLTFKSIFLTKVKKLEFIIEAADESAELYTGAHARGVLRIKS